MKILNFKISQTRKRITVVTDSGKFSLEQFGKDAISISPLPYIQKSHHRYLSLKKAFQSSDYFLRENKIASETEISGLKDRLRVFLNVELKTI